MQGPEQTPQNPPPKESKPKNAHALLKTLPPPPETLVDVKNSKTYARGGSLGEGGFARCYEVTDENGRKLAAKVVSKLSLKSTKQRQKLLSEIKVHSTLSHKYIVKFLSVFEDDSNVYMILELCENKNFVEFLKKRKRLTEHETRFYMFQLLDAVAHMHSHRVIHRDLKLGNLFLTKNMDMKIGDFGLAANIKHDGERKRTICGTPNYIAPEVLFDTQNGHSFEVDIWSLGVIMYTLIIGRPPFQTKEVNAIYKKIKDNSYEFPANVSISEEAKNMIQALLHTRPECRPMAKDIMGHAFMQTGYFPKYIPVNALEMVPDFRGITDMNANKKPVPIIDNHVSVPNLPIPPVIDVRPKIIKDIKPLARVNPLRAPLPGVWVQPKERERVEPLRPTPANDSRSNIPNIPIPVKPVTQRIEKIIQEEKENSKTTSSQISPPKAVPAIQNANEIEPEKKKAQKSEMDNLIKTLGNHSISSPNASDSYRRAAKSLDVMYTTLLNALNDVKNNKVLPRVPIEVSGDEKNINFITKWIDYSNKYGLGYQLRDGSVGVYFNDTTSIILSPDNKKFEYLFNEKVGDRQKLIRQHHEMETYPKELRKKVTLLKHFKSYMHDNLYRATDAENLTTENFDYLSKYIRTKHGVVFRLSNQILQINLFDHTKIILSKQAQIVTYIDKERVLTTKYLQDVLVSNDKELIDRLKFARDMLHSMITKKQEKEMAGMK